MTQIQEPSPFATPFEWIGGEARVRELTESFYDLMDLEPTLYCVAFMAPICRMHVNVCLCFCVVGWAGRLITPINLGILGCVCVTCRFRLALKNVISGWLV
jgi:Bacterial-like globin